MLPEMVMVISLLLEMEAKLFCTYLTGQRSQDIRYVDKHPRGLHELEEHLCVLHSWTNIHLLDVGDLVRVFK